MPSGLGEASKERVPLVPLAQLRPEMLLDSEEGRPVVSTKDTQMLSFFFFVLLVLT